MKKRMIAAALCLCMAAGLMPTAAYAAEGDKTIMLGTDGIGGWDSKNGYDYITAHGTAMPSNGGCWTTRPIWRQMAYFCFPSTVWERTL